MDLPAGVAPTPGSGVHSIALYLVAPHPFHLELKDTSELLNFNPYSAEEKEKLLMELRATCKGGAAIASSCVSSLSQLCCLPRSTSAVDGEARNGKRITF